MEENNEKEKLNKDIDTLLKYSKPNLIVFLVFSFFCLLLICLSFFDIYNKNYNSFWLNLTVTIFSSVALIIVCVFFVIRMKTYKSEKSEIKKEILDRLEENGKDI